VPFAIWTGIDAWRVEVAEVELDPDALRATGTQVGVSPVPYRLDYRLEAAGRFVTRSIELAASGDGWRRALLLRHDGSGGWTTDYEQSGDASLPPIDDVLPELDGALDCDVESSPLTNTMPVLRGGFRSGGAGDLLMAFVSVPSLVVSASPQRYEHIRPTAGGSLVRYLSRDGDFTAELTLDADGLVEHYSSLARRVTGEPPPPATR
jgi:hypothetical protein